MAIVPSKGRMNRWRWFRRLPARERALVVAALGALPLAAASLRLLGFERTRGLFEQLTRFPLAPVRRPEAIAPRSSVTALSAPFWMRNSAISRFPAAETQCSGVRPRLLRTLMSAPPARSVRTTSRWLCCAASWSGRS